MPRKRLLRTGNLVYHVTARSNNREWFYIPTAQCWEIMKTALSTAIERYGAEIHSFLLMDNHFHLLCSTPWLNLDDVMRYFLSETAREIQRLSGRTNHIFGTRYKWSLLSGSAALAYAFKYVYRNPVRAGLVRNVEDYSYSSLVDYQSLPLSEGFNQYWALIPKDPATRLSWLNQPTPKEVEAQITRALRRFSFEFSSQSSQQSHLRQLRALYGVE